MESSPTALLKFLLPKTPFLFKTALWHTLSLSPTSSKWDLRTELTVNMLRDMLGGGGNSNPQPISKLQHLTCKDPGVKGKMWVSKVELPVVGEDDVRQMVFHAIRDMGTGEEEWSECENRGVEGEWNAYRGGVKDDEAEPTELSEKEKYDALIAETSSKVTVLYFHGGAMYLLDPATYRATTSRIAKETGGRVFSVRYRLSPQHPFPAALLDCLTAYLSLLYPPPGSPHAPIPASEIVIAGDSAGGTCCTALLQLLLHFHRSSPNPTTTFNGTTVPLPLPAALALTSPWLDISRSLPSIEANVLYDYLPPPSLSLPSPPPCAAWPANPPRAELYCETSTLCHPLVSPLAARDWHRAPPVLVSLGQEMMRDEAAVFARRLASQGVKVRWCEFEAMPHDFAMVMSQCPAAEVHFGEMGRFCREVVVGEGGTVVETSGEFILARSLERKRVDVREGLTEIKEEEVEEYMRKGRERIEEKFRRGQEPSMEARPML